MAKKKTKSKATRMGNLMSSAKKGHQYNVGAGGNVFDPNMSHVRGVRLPSLGLMYMFGFSALRDSCTVLIDGKTGSSKSSLAIDMFNWGLPYAAAGAIIDTENKAAFDIANGMLNDMSLYLPGHLHMKATLSVEETQAAIAEEVARCRDMNGIKSKPKKKAKSKAKQTKAQTTAAEEEEEANKKRDEDELARDDQIPFIVITDSLAAAASEETKAHIQKQGHADRGHGGRVEALLWSIWLKEHEASIADLPFISVFVNHVKEKQEQKGARTVSTEINPGGVAQNYATTIQIRCSGGKQFISNAVDGISYQDIYLKCVKNSRGPTGLSTVVRKCSKRNEDGSTTFWWDWGRCTAMYLGELSGKHPARQICPVTKVSDTKYTCKTVGMDKEDPGTVGDAIHAKPELVEELIKANRIYNLREFTKLSDEEFQHLTGEAAAAKEAYLAQLAEEI